MFSLQRRCLLACFASAVLLGSAFAAATPEQPEPAGAAGMAVEASPSVLHLPPVRIVSDFAPPGESNVRSSIRLRDGIALIGTEESGDIYKSEDAGRTWRKTVDGGEAWDIADVRNFLRAADGRLYATTSEPATVLRSRDEGENWQVVARPKASRTVGIAELDGGTLLVGLRRSENDRISLIRSEDGFAAFDWIALSDDLPRQNVTCLISLGEEMALAGVGYEGSGKIFKTTDAGRTWHQTGEFPDARDLMSFFRVGDTLFVTASGIATIYGSDDDGETWGRSQQVWEKGFLGECIEIHHAGRLYLVLCATDQREKPYRHVLLISGDAGNTWTEWIEIARDESGGASNLERINNNTLIVGTGNHSAQGHVYTLEIQ